MELVRRRNPGTTKIEGRKLPEIELTPINYQMGGKTLASPTNKVAVVNSESGQVYDLVSKNYSPIMHGEAIEHVISAIPKEWGAPVDSLWLSPDGGKMRLDLVFSKMEGEVQVGDIINPTITLFNSYDKSLNFRVLLNAFRLVCSNGMTTTQNYLSYSRRHVGEFDQPALRENMNRAIDLFQDEMGVWRLWAEQPALPAHYEEMVNFLDLGVKAQEEIEKEVEISSGLTIDNLKVKTLSKWDLYNIVTQYLTHSVPSMMVRTNYENKLRRFFADSDF